MIELIIFDCDGTLIESETLASEIESDLLKELGLSLTPLEINRRFAGVSPQEMRDIIQDEHNLALPTDFFAQFEHVFFGRAPQELEATPNAHHVLSQITQPQCVASNSTGEWVETNLKATDLYHFFEDRIYPATLVAQGKPAPDIFHFAARAHNVDPAKCLVIEDSPSGIQAACRAGMPVLGYIGGAHCQHDHADRLRQAGADVIIEDLLEILDQDMLTPQNSLGQNL